MNQNLFSNHIFLCLPSGVAGFVVNEKNELLVIQEKYHPGSKSAKWKLPGGHADKGTHL